MNGTGAPDRSSTGSGVALEPAAVDSNDLGVRLGKRRSRSRKRFLLRTASVAGVGALLALSAGGWLSYKANQVKDQLAEIAPLAAQFKTQLVAKDNAAAVETLQELKLRTSTAKASSSDPLWKVASLLPWIGPNFAAVSDVSSSANDVVEGAAEPLLRAFGSLGWEALTPVDGGFNMKPLRASSSSIVSAAKTVELAHTRLSAIDVDQLLPEVSVPLVNATQTLDDMRGTLSTAADTSRILPPMLGTDRPRNYLLLVQNNAEVRATGGLPGVLAVLTVDKGKVRLTAQSSGSAMGAFSPPVHVDPDQTRIYSARLGTYISDVNLTPDFPTAAKAAKSMWETRHGTQIDGVVALDTVVLTHLLDASGPVSIATDGELHSATGLPQRLTSANVVKTLLSDVYNELENNEQQDAYFAAVSRAVFEEFVSGATSGKKVVDALLKSADEMRILVWSDHKDEQQILNKTTLSGSVTGASVRGSAFGVFFNDGTGAKMDYHVKRTVRLARECTGDEYLRYRVLVTLHNTAPRDAAQVLPELVTGAGRFGVPPGLVQTNIVVYGPAQSHIEEVHQDGTKVAFGSQLHDGRPVGTVTTRLEPGQKRNFELRFGGVVQHNDPSLRITPTVQSLKDVLQPSAYDNCSR